MHDRRVRRSRARVFLMWTPRRKMILCFSPDLLRWLVEDVVLDLFGFCLLAGFLEFCMLTGFLGFVCWLVFVARILATTAESRRIRFITLPLCEIIVCSIARRFVLTCFWKSLHFKVFCLFGFKNHLIYLWNLLLDSIKILQLSILIWFVIFLKIWGQDVLGDIEVSLVSIP